MFKPSPNLCARLRLTTKQVNGGFYRGSRTGSMGAHTEYGGYVVDWRKVRHFNVPDLTEFKLTPFVTMEMQPTPRTTEDIEGNIYTPSKVDAMQYLQQWRDANPQEYDHILNYQAESEAAETPAEAASESPLETPTGEKDPHTLHTRSSSELPDEKRSGF